MQMTWNPSPSNGVRVITLEVLNSAGQYEPINNSTVYTVATNSFERAGGDGYTVFLADAIAPLDGGFTLLPVMHN